MLPGEDPEEIDLDPGEAAEELLARLLDAHRYRAAADLPAGTGCRPGGVSVPLGAAAAVAAAGLAEGRRRRLRPSAPRVRRSATCSLLPEPVDLRHITVPKVTVAERLAHLRQLLRRGTFTFDEAVARADRVTVAVTLFALLELYKQGELTWAQDEPFGEITIESAGARATTRLTA